MTDIYIDFDGVILNTWEIFYNQYCQKYNTTVLEERKIKDIMVNSDWDKVLKESEIINDIINNLIELSNKYNIIILTKVNCLSEKNSKLKYLNNVGIENIVFVGYEQQKSSVVNPNGKILIDDDIQNLDDWSNNGGISLFFNSKHENIDSYGRLNYKYTLIDNLRQLYDTI